MHSYSTNSPDRQFIPFVLAAFAIAGGYLISVAFDHFQVIVPWWAPPADTMTLYGLVYWLFDQYVWRSSLLRILGIVRIPDLNGKWSGRVRPTETEGVSLGLTIDTEIRVTISQSWQNISIRGETDRSHFHSTAACVRTEDSGLLEYQYVSDPFASAPATMETHRGTVSYGLSEDSKALKGEYYSGRGRQNIGMIDLRRVP